MRITLSMMLTIALFIAGSAATTAQPPTEGELPTTTGQQTTVGEEPAKAGYDFFSTADYSADLESPESVVRACFETLSVGSTEEFDLMRYYNLFNETADIRPTRMMDMGIPALNARLHPMVFLVYYGLAMLRNDFSEEILEVKTIEFGRIAQVTTISRSTYTEDGNTISNRSVTCFQLMNLGQGWKITSIMFEPESDERQIPVNLLK